ncbi:Uncharacterised protein [Legionella beliardensis]|uniref:Uncharacterized protein n=1 Tax=Legionella beliardensis TaxID=91822 RepID=A0A378ICU1_9GAMM|nr:hypothetical protein [Legionella beliardensis]STX30114.1 Uncharacterised protein [Legionella beliardensis]
MTGFFSSQVANTLSSWSNYYMDWSRVGELLREGTHRYSWHELIQRGTILASMGEGLYLGYNYSDSDSWLNRGLYSMSGCFVGFVVSHLVVIAPLIYKRYQLSQDCTEAQKMILNSLQDLRAYPNDSELIDSIIDLVTTQVKAIMEMNLSNEKHSNASLTWGKRRTLLTNLAAELKQDIHGLNTTNNPFFLDELEKRWSQKLASFKEEFKHHSANGTDHEDNNSSVDIRQSM